MESVPHVNRERMRALLQRMIDIYSPTGKEEEILEFLFGYLEQHHIPVQRQNVDGHRYNLLVLPDGDVHMALMGHLDTVPAYDLEEYGYVEKGDLIQGLGSADMKGGCAAMVEAFISLSERGESQPSAALAMVVGEELEGDGAATFTRELEVPWVVIGEPSVLVPCLSSYGYVEVQLTTRGKRLHASLADQVQNPISMMMRLIMKVIGKLEERHPEIVYNLRDFFSTRAGFIVPDLCEAWLDVHVPPSMPLNDIVIGLEEVFEEEKEGNAAFNGSIRFATVAPGYELPEEGQIVDTLRNIYWKRELGWQPEPFRSHSDANQLWRAGVKPIILGPGQLDRAHTPEEAVLFSEVVQAADIYYELLSTVRHWRI